MKIGLITYHSAYNFGSVLQAYATQEIIKELAGNCEIINYRMKEQRRVYAVFIWNKGIRVLKSFVKNALILANYKTRKNRSRKYEALFTNLFSLSEECVEPEDVYRIWNKYDLIVSGSDQVWNKHSNEMENVSWDYMMPYLLHGFKGKKVSYASSFGNMLDNEIEMIVPEINQFEAVSMREKSSAIKLNELCAIDVKNVLDPTFLISSEEWIKRFDLHKKGEKYILYYALNGRKNIKEARRIIEEYARKANMKVKMIAPLGFFRSSSNVEILDDVDPVDFLNLIYEAETVITDSYHGTILSVNMGKDIYSICGENVSDFRKTDIMERIGLKDRIINDMNELLHKEFNPINYDIVYNFLTPMRVESRSYLEKILKM